MSNSVFDFCINSRVAEEMPPDEPNVMSMNGWDFAGKPKIPYRASFKVTLYGLRWLLNGAGTALDVTTDGDKNAGRLRNFYLTHRLWDSFLFNHQYLGQLRVRFQKPIQLPPAEGESNGMISPLEIILIHHNPSFS